MQGNNHTNVKNILLALANHANVKGIRGLANYLELNEGVLYAWINREKIADTGSILIKFPNLNPQWLETGEVPMFKPPAIGDIPNIDPKKFRQFAEEIGKTSVKVDQLEYEEKKDGLVKDEADIVGLVRSILPLGDNEDRRQRLKRFKDLCAEEARKHAEKKEP